jgi:CheY-like chemotaxis protein
VSWNPSPDGAAATTPAATPAAAQVRPRVLVVDDEDLVRLVISRRLRLAGFDVAEARDGLEALAFLPGVGADIVLTDLNMPRLNGEQLIRELRRSASTAALPVLLMTGGPIDEARLREAGCSGFVYKPLPDSLPDILKALLAPSADAAMSGETGAAARRSARHPAA